MAKQQEAVEAREEDVDPTTGARLPAAKMAQRNAEIVQAKMRGLSWRQIAATYGLTERRCKQIHREYRESNPTLRNQDPVEIVDELLEGYQAVVEELALISATTGNDNARVGAINAKMSAFGKVTELLQAIGVLPHDLGQLRVEIDGRFVADQVVRVLREFNASPEMLEAIAEALEGGRPVIEHRELEPAT